MRNKLLAATALITVTLVPLTAHAQDGAVGGAAAGAVGGAVVGGPVGAVVGGVGGAILGGLTEETRPRFREYVVTKKHPSYRYDGEVVVGSELPSSGVTYYEVPHEYGVKSYRYTVVNNRTVLVDPKTRRIVEIIE